MQIPISFDLQDYPATELMALRSQINREFSRFSRTFSRGQMDFVRTEEGKIRCSVELRTKRGEKLYVSEETDSVKQAYKTVVQGVQQRLRDIEKGEAERPKQLRQSGGIFQT